MKSTNRMKTRIIAGVLSAITVFSVGTAAISSASAAELTVSSVVKDVGSCALTLTIEKFVTNNLAGSLLKMGAGYLLDWVFDSKGEKEPTVKDALDKIEDLRKTVNLNHEEEMNNLRVINSNIDTKDFRMEADSIRDDYKNALKEIRRHSDNISFNREGVIDAKTYGAYKKILASSSCNIPSLEKNFNKMKEYVLGEPFIKDCTFKNNKANNGFGGAIRTFHIDNNNVIKNCQFTNNSGRGANVFVQYAHGMGEKLTKDWGNTINSTFGNGMGIVYK